MEHINNNYSTIEQRIETDINLRDSSLKSERDLEKKKNQSNVFQSVKKPNDINTNFDKSELNKDKFSEIIKENKNMLNKFEELNKGLNELKDLINSNHNYIKNIIENKKLYTFSIQKPINIQLGKENHSTPHPSQTEESKKKNSNQKTQTNKERNNNKPKVKKLFEKVTKINKLKKRRQNNLNNIENNTSIRSQNQTNNNVSFKENEKSYEVTKTTKEKKNSTDKLSAANAKKIEDNKISSILENNNSNNNNKSKDINNNTTFINNTQNINDNNNEKNNNIASTIEIKMANREEKLEVPEHLRYVIRGRKVRRIFQIRKKEENLLKVKYFYRLFLNGTIPLIKQLVKNKREEDNNNKNNNNKSIQNNDKSSEENLNLYKEKKLSVIVNKKDVKNLSLLRKAFNKFKYNYLLSRINLKVLKDKKHGKNEKSQRKKKSSSQEQRNKEDNKITSDKKKKKRNLIKSSEKINEGLGVSDENKNE